MTFVGDQTNKEPINTESWDSSDFNQTAPKQGLSNII